MMFMGRHELLNWKRTVQDLFAIIITLNPEQVTGCIREYEVLHQNCSFTPFREIDLSPSLLMAHLGILWFLVL